uniref:Predicted protein n=1 Tax=Hordeum vulgare subsp. vulgare TaxID=112509 RepID=F2EEU6_HORVV|nr:predicted protein [Hordeum vulgare subsp. vulgare]
MELASPNPHGIAPMRRRPGPRRKYWSRISPR